MYPCLRYCVSRNVRLKIFLIEINLINHDCLQNCFSYILLVRLALPFADVLQPLCHGPEQVLQAIAVVFLQHPDGVFETACVSSRPGRCSRCCSRSIVVWLFNFHAINLKQIVFKLSWEAKLPVLSEVQPRHSEKNTEYCNFQV